MATLTQEVEEMTVKVRGGNGGSVATEQISSLSIGRDGQVVLNLMEPHGDIPAHIQDKAQTLLESFHGQLEGRVDAYLKKLSETNGDLKPEAGEPIIFGQQFWNVLTYGPYQFGFNPAGPHRPSKIIANGQWALMVGLVWVNPMWSWILSSRGYRVRFESIDLTNVMNGPGATFTGTFPAVVPQFNYFFWFFNPGDPGINPRLYETSLTADITDPNIPFAAFSTWHRDPDWEPGFAGRPPRFPEWQYDCPARYMVYRRLI
jgi:hypothetical protein